MVAPVLPGSALAAAVALCAIAMVTSFPYAKLTRVLKLPPWLLLLPVIGALINLPATFGVVVTGYLVSGPLLWLRQRHPLAHA